MPSTVSNFVITFQSGQKLRSSLQAVKKRGKTIGFVPTMGCFHEGHLSLIRRARKETDCVVVSIFVNPTQFGPREDFRFYPRNIRQDLRFCRDEKVDFVFMPRVPTLYPTGFQTFVEPGLLASKLCGKTRPGHFRGVATIVTKLFNLVQPSIAYFGRKDYQQALIIQRLVRDLDFYVQVKICPTLREKNGLAMSSRNTYLNRQARQKALCLRKSLLWARSQIRSGLRDTAILKHGIRRILSSSLSNIDYVEILRARDLSPVRKLSGKIIIALAGFVNTGGGRRVPSQVRLIDNEIFKV